MEVLTICESSSKNFMYIYSTLKTTLRSVLLFSSFDRTRKGMVEVGSYRMFIPLRSGN